MRLPPLSRALPAAVLILAGAPADAPAAQPTASTWTARAGSEPVRLARPADFLAVSWRGTRAGGAIRLRRGGRWTAWRPLRPGDAAARGRTGSELVPARRAGAVQVRLPRGSRGGRLVAIRSASSPARRASTRLSSPVGPLCFYTRAAWGADESLRVPNPPAFFPVQTLTVHHTVTANDDPDPAATVRAIYAQHVLANGFDDIGYQLLIDAAGCVYEGRASGDDGLPVYGRAPAPGRAVPGRERRPRGRVQRRQPGVALLGEFTGGPPTPAARRSLTGVLALLAAVSGVDPSPAWPT